MGSFPEKNQIMLLVTCGTDSSTTKFPMSLLDRIGHNFRSLVKQGHTPTQLETNTEDCNPSAFLEIRNKS
jgi:hypothetical protein